MKVFNIHDFGARFCDSLQTKPIQDAIDACFLAGGGRVVVPCGIYLTGGIRLRSNVELYLESGAYLKGSSNPYDYLAWMNDELEPVEIEQIVPDDPKRIRSSLSTSRWSNGLIRAFDARNISVIGEKGSYIDGNNCFDPEGEEKYRGPHGMSIWRCENIHMEGYTFVHSGNWCHAFFASQNITVKNISVYGGHDGVDIRTCDNVLIEKCNFNTGDDVIAGFDNHDVVVRDCILNSACQAIRLGGNNILVENCVSKERPFGFRKHLPEESKMNSGLTSPECRHDLMCGVTYYCDYRADLRRPAENITIRNCHFSQVMEVIRLEFDGLHRWCCNRSLRQIRLEDCTLCEIMRPGMLWGDEDEKVTCHFKNVKIICKEGYEDEPLFVAGNFDKIIFEDCTIEGFNDPRILVATDGEVEVIRSTPIKAQKSTQEECLDAHPWGVYSADRIAGRTFKNG